MSKRYCRKCGAEIPEGAKFCPDCGTPVIPDDSNTTESTKIMETTNPDQQNTTDIPRFDQTEKTQNITPSDSGNGTRSDYYSRHRESDPYNNPDYTNGHEEYDAYEKTDHHVGLIILIVIIAACVGLFFFLFFAKPEFLTGLLPGHHETAAETETSVNETSKPQKKEKTEESDDSDDKALPEDTASPEATSGVLGTTDSDTEPATATQKGTVYISADVSGPQRIKVRTGPSQSAADTNARKYNGDSVTVYEIKQAEGYTWYRIGDNQWIAGNGSTFGVNLN